MVNADGSNPGSVTNASTSGIRECYPIVRDESTFLYVRAYGPTKEEDVNQVYKGYFDGTPPKSIPANKNLDGSLAVCDDPYPCGSQYVFMTSSRKDEDGKEVWYDLYLADIESTDIWPLNKYNPNVNTDLKEMELGPCYTPFASELGLITFVPGIEKRPGYHSVDALALSPDGAKLYAAHWESGVVSTVDPVGVYSTSDYSLLDEIPIGPCVGGVEVSPDGRYVYAPVYYGDKVYRFDTFNNNTKTSITLGSWINKLWKNPDGTKLIANYGATDGDPSTSTTLALIDISGGSFSKLKTLPMGRPVYSPSIAFSQNGDYMYIGCASSTSKGPCLVRIAMDTFTISESLELATGAGIQKALAGVVRAGDYLYVADQSNKKLYVISEAGFSKKETMDLTSTPLAIGLDPLGRYLIILTQDESGSEGVIAVLDLSSLRLMSVMSGLNPSLADIKFSPDGKKAFLAHANQALGGFTVVELK